MRAPAGEPSLRGELLRAAALGPFLDDVERRVDEPLIQATGGLIDEIERQSLLSDWQRTAVAMDGTAVVTVKAFRFRNPAFGRMLVRPQGRRDVRPPVLPPGAVATVGKQDADYAERAVLFSKGPTFVRLEVISLKRPAPAESRALLSRAARLQYGRLSQRRSLPGTSVKTGQLKRRLAISTIVVVVVLIVLVALLTAVRDRSVRQGVANVLRGRPEPPPHAVDVDAAARSTRRRLARAGRRRALFTVALVILIEVLPIPLAPSLAILVGGLVAWNVVSALVEHAVAGRRRLRLFGGLDVAIGIVAGALSLTLVVAGLMVAWFGIVSEVMGTPEVSDDALARFRTLCVIAGVLLLAFSRVPMTVGRRLAMRRLSARNRADRRPDVLLLRSFADDDLRIRVRELHRSGLDRLALRRWERFEEVLALSLSEVGPVEAVGEPGRRLPPLGATRTYYGDADWQAGVAHRIGSVELVVLSMGRTPAVGWEVAKIKEMGALNRAIFVIPPVDPQDRRARLHLLAELLHLDSRLFDHEQQGLEVLAAVVCGDGRPALVTSGTRDDASYDLALRSAVGLLVGEIRTGAPAVAAAGRRPPLPAQLLREPGAGSTRRPWYRRPWHIALAVVGALVVVQWGIYERTRIDRFHELADTPAIPRFLVHVEHTDAVVAVQNAEHGVSVTEIDARSGAARRLAVVAAAPTRGAARGSWVVLMSPADGTVSGVNRHTGATWTTHVAGAPQGAAVGPRTAAVALPDRDEIAEFRLRDGRLVGHTPVAGAPFAITSWPDDPFVSLSGRNRVVRLEPRGRLQARAFFVARPRQVFRTAGGMWAVSARTGGLVRLRDGASATPVLSAGELVPRVAACDKYVALAIAPDSTISVFDSRTGARVRLYHPPEDVHALALTDAGRLVVSFYDYRDVGIYDLHDREVGDP